MTPAEAAPLGVASSQTAARANVGWAPFAFAALGLFGVWGVLYKTLAVSPVTAQILAAFGELPVILFLGARLWTGRAKPAVAVPSAGRADLLSFSAGALTCVGNLALYAAMDAGGQATTLIPLTNLYPVVTVVLAALFLRERPGRLQWLCVVAAIASIALLTHEDSATAPDTKANTYLSAALPITSITLWGVSALLQKLATDRNDNAVRATFFYLLSAPATAIALLLARSEAASELTQAFASPSVLAKGTALGTTLALGNWLFIGALARGGPASTVTSLAGLYPVITVPLAVVVLHETVAPHGIAGLVLGVVAVVGLARATPAPAANHP